MDRTANELVEVVETSGPLHAGDTLPGVLWRDCPVPGWQVAPLVNEHRNDTRAAGPSPISHAFSVDVEDWQQSVYNRLMPVSDRFVAPTYRVAELLDRLGTRATFFVLGNAARKTPQLIADLARAGHEIQLHGYDHTELREMTPDAFRQDLMRARGIIEGVIGTAVTGYRAPRFSIDRRNPWTLDVLAECGFRYDSSIFPLRIRGYGIAGWVQTPHRVRTAGGNELVEVPVAAGEILGRRFPLGGGGYFRLLPWAVIRKQFHKMEDAGRPATVYCHPHEFDPDAFAQLPFRVPLRLRLHQGIGRRAFPGRIEKLLTEFRFGPIRDLIHGHVVKTGSAQRSTLVPPAATYSHPVVNTA